MSRAQRTRALREFQGDPPTTIFLLSLRAGAVGINLTEANRVFLMEPALNPALEAQAIGRVHRLGQVNAVEITRFAVKGSIEERILKLQEMKYGSRAVGGGKGGGGKKGVDGGGKKGGEAANGGDARDGGGAALNGAAAANLSDGDDDDEFLEANGAGHLNADKMTAKTEEFDLIFGVTAADLEARRQAHQAPRAAPPPPAVWAGPGGGAGGGFGGYGPPGGAGGAKRGHPPKEAPPIVEMPKANDDVDGSDDDQEEVEMPMPKKALPTKGKGKKDDDEYDEEDFSDSEGSI